MKQLQKIARTKLGNLLPANFSSIQRLSDKVIDVVCPLDGQAKGLGDKRICFFNSKAFTVSALCTLDVGSVPSAHWTPRLFTATAIWHLLMMIIINLISIYPVQRL